MASGAQLGFFDYVKAAFNRRFLVPGLGSFRLNRAALAIFAVLGLANPGFWLLGAAGELLYLVLMASSERFQRVVKAQEKYASRQTDQQRIERSLSRLGEKSRERYLKLLAQCHEIVKLSDTLDERSIDSVAKLRTGNLNQLLWIFLRLLTSREVLVKTMKETRRREVEEEIERLEERIAAEADSESQLARSLGRSLEIQRRRLENVDLGEKNMELLEVELDRIEQQVALIREESAVVGKAEALSERLDAVSGTLAETNRWMEQHAELFGGMEGLDAPAAGSLPSVTPPLPETEI